MFYEVEQHIQLLENFIKSANKQQFIKELKHPSERLFLQVLTSDFQDIQTFKKEFNKLELSPKFKEQILKYKFKNFVQQRNEINNKQLLENLRQIFVPYSSFNYPKPVNIRRHQMVDQVHQVNTKVEVLNKNVQNYINQKVLEDKNFMSKLDMYGWTQLKESTILQLELREKQKYFRQNNLLSKLNVDSMDKILTKYLAQYKKQNRLTQPNFDFSFPFQKLTVQQLNGLGKKNKDLFHNVNFCTWWIRQNYSQFIEQYSEANSQSIEDQSKNLKQLTKIYSELQERNSSFYIKQFQLMIATQILATEIELKNPQLKTLQGFLKDSSNNLSAFPYFTQKFKSTLYQRNSKTPNLSYRTNYLDKSKFRGCMRGLQLLLEDYIIELFRKQVSTKSKSSVGPLSEIIELNYLRKLQCKVKLMQGVKCEQVTDFWPANQLVMFKQKKEIKISQRNKTIYKSDDEVVLKMTLKNVKQLQIKVYQINLLKDYLTNNSSQSRVYDDLNLSYFSPTFTDHFINPSDNPFQPSVVSVKIKDIPKRLGLFIVDFQGEGIVSRAVIRKGCIVCLQNYSLEGQTFCFYNEQGKQLTEKDGLQIWVEKQKINLKNNMFNSNSLQPESVGQKTEIIAAVGCFAQKYIKTFKHTYNLKISALYNNQSFISGNKARIILNGWLKMNDNEISLKKLRKIKAVVNQISDKVIVSSNTYQITEWSDERDVSLEFLNLRDINSISIQVRAQVQGQKQCIVKSNELEISITSMQKRQDQIIAQPYLKQLLSKDYQLHFLGKNGQPIKQSEVNLDFRMKGTNYIEKLKFFTDNRGIIDLGLLSSVTTMSCVYNNEQRTWVIDRSFQRLAYDSQIYAFPKQQICLPANKQWTRQDISLIHQLAQNNYKNDEIQNVTLKGGLLSFRVGDKQSSIYKLTILPLSKQITIKVVSKGAVWKQEVSNKKIVIDADQQKIKQINKNSPLRNIYIETLSTKIEKSTYSVKFQVANLSHIPQSELKKMRIHVFATNYVSPNVEGAFTTNNYLKQNALIQQSRQLNKSTFLCNKTLSEQAAYIFNRQKEKTRIGSNLEKPGIFLKRLAVRQTQDVVGQLAGEGRFEGAGLRMDKSKQARRYMDQKCVGLRTRQKNITHHNIFLQHSGFLQSNVSIGQRVQIPKEYTHIQAYLITPECGSKATFSLSNEDAANKDIKFKGLAECEANKFWNISQQAYCVRAGQSKEFQKKCQYKVITLTEIFEYVEKVILANRNEKLYSWKDKLLFWESYTSEEKIKIYNKYYCHQLNVFLKFKDQPFFQAIVRPYLSNKFKKTIIDLCLLEDPQVLSYLQINKLSQLTYFENSLLVYVLIKLQKKKQAENLVNRLKLQQDKKIPFKVDHKNFDYIINSFAGKQELKPAAIQESALQKPFEAPKLKMKMKRRTSEMMARSQSRSQSQDRQLQASECQFVQKKKKKVQVDSTKEYTQHTFYYDADYKYPCHQNNPINSLFWVELAQHFLNGGTGAFTSASFTEFSNALETMLAAAFIPGRESNLYLIEQEGANYKISAKVDLLLFVKQLKQYSLAQRSGIYIYQALSTTSTTQPGKQVAVSQIKAGQEYKINTIFNNSTAQNLELQVLSPIPEGSIPLDFKQIYLLQVKLGPYSTHVHKQKVYFPHAGSFKIPTANILHQKQGIILAHSQANHAITVIEKHETKNLESFEDILRFGTKSAIVQFLKTKNIFAPQIFNPQQILWMLSDISFFNEILSILKQRFYYSRQIWKFAFLHGNCKAIAEYLDIEEQKNKAYSPINLTRTMGISNQAFEYYPYFQKRAHRYANQNRSAIKNVDLKQTYISFLISLIISKSETNPKNKLAYAYYLILQDRLTEALQVTQSLSATDRKMCEIQLDYVNCFLDMGINGSDCHLAKKIACKYLNYPVKEWKTLFEQIIQTLKQPPQNEIEDKEAVQTKVTLLENGDIRIQRSTKNQISLQIFPTNLQLFYSEHSFQFKKVISNYSISKPAKQITISSAENNSEIIIKKEQFGNITNPYLQVIQHTKVTHRRIKSLFWSDPRIHLKLYEQQGVVQIFTNGKRVPGCYIKVFNLRKGDKKDKKAIFYVDGYSDITGKFKYALSDLSLIQKFALLIVTDIGSVIKFVAPPKTNPDANKKKYQNRSVSSSSSGGSHSSSQSDFSSPEQINSSEPPKIGNKPGRLLRRLS